MVFFENASYGNIPLPTKGIKLRNTQNNSISTTSNGYYGACMTEDNCIIGVTDSTRLGIWNAETGVFYKDVVVVSNSTNPISSFHNATRRIYLTSKSSNAVNYVTTTGYKENMVINTTIYKHHVLPDTFQAVMPQWVSDEELWVLGYNDTKASSLFIYKKDVLVKTINFMANLNDKSFIYFRVGNGWFMIDSSPDDIGSRAIDYYTIDKDVVTYRESLSGPTNKAKSWTVNQYVQIGGSQAFMPAYNYATSLIGFANGRGTYASYEIYEKNNKSMVSGGTSIQIQVAYSQDGMNFTPFATFDSSKVVQQRFIKLRVVLDGGADSGKVSTFLFDQASKETKLSLNEFVEQVTNKISVRKIFRKPIQRDLSIQESVVFKASINKADFKKITGLIIK